MSEKIRKEKHGYDVIGDCKISPSVGCCCDLYDLTYAERCFTWWPAAYDGNYYEENPLKGNCPM